MKKIKADYESLKKIIIDENVQLQLNNKINENKKEIDTKVSKETYNNSLDRINKQFDTKADDDDLKTLETRMNTFERLPDGSTTGDAELIDGRVGIDGTSYTLIGNNIRETTKNIYSFINNAFDFKNETLTNLLNKNKYQ